MGAPQVGSKSSTYEEAYVESDATVQTYVATMPQQVARYLGDDLQDLIRTTGLSLADALDIPPGSRNRYVRNPEHLVDLLFNDITRMLNDRLVQRVHLLLCDPHLDENSGAYKVLYHARYDISIPQRSLAREELKEAGGRLNIGRLNPGNTRFALVIDWSPRASPAEIRNARRPHYNFDWAPLTDSFDQSGTVEYRRGGLGHIVVRIESMRPRDIPLAR